MIDPQHEPPISLTEACKLKPLQRNGKRPSPSTLWRWATGGVRGCKLETLRIGGMTCTTEAAILRLLARLNGHADDPAASPIIRDRQIAKAERALDAAGIC